jgi:predicted dinucleotide-binding enzyme
MKIGIIGAGMIGAAAARLFVNAGHEVAVSNSRGPASLTALVANLGPRAKAMTVADAARWGPDPAGGAVAGARSAPAGGCGRREDRRRRDESVRGRWVIDLGVTTSPEATRKRLPGARLVKAFNTIWFKHLAERGRPDRPVDDRHAIFLAGDDESAKRTVIDLIEAIGFGAVDTGSLGDGGRRQEPGTPLYNQVITVRDARALIP